VKLAFYLAAKGSPKDKIIAAYTGGPFSHCELVINDAYLPYIPEPLIYPHDAGGSLCYSSSSAAPRDGCGFEVIDLADGKWTLCSLPPANWSAAVMKAVADSGKPYDWRGIVGFVVKGQDNKNERFCSEECVLLLQASGLLLGVNAVMTSPNYLAQLVGVL
jgi:hypothetical protein